jgi:F-type H+-transporting ATPase subunit gamma
MSLLQLRTRLKTIKSLNSIFSALEVVTVVRTKRVREPFQMLERYLRPLHAVLAGRVAAVKTTQKVLVVITANRGLCGSFNNLVTGKAREFLAVNPDAGLVLIGRLGAVRLGKLNKRILFTAHDVAEKTSFAGVERLAARLAELGAEIHIAYNTYKSAVVQVPKLYRFFPVPEELALKQDPAEFILEPEPNDLTAEMFRHYLAVRLFQILLDSQMGELAARLMVLNGAIDTSKELTDTLFIQINKARQAAITKDLLEIVSAAEALRRDDD